MKGDFSRVTFRREKHYVGVELEQGRVISDATFNEEQAIRQYHEEVANQDVIGASGAPREHAGFALSLVDSGLHIGGGRYYVDGILIENEGDGIAYDDQLGRTPVLELLEGEGAEVGLVYLEVWQRYITPLHDEHIREKALGGPDDSGRIQTWWRVNVLPLPSADVASIRDTLHALLVERAQVESELRASNDANRRRTLQAQINGLNGQIENLLASADLVCEGEFEELDQLRRISTGTMNASTVEGAAEDGPCSLPAEGGFLGLENQLYRVQIYRSGTRSRARFIWSRENGSVVQRITNFNDSEITLQSLGRDLNIGFGDLSRYEFVELFNDETEARGESGQLVRVANIREEDRVLELAAEPTINTDLALNPKVRRWDQTRDQAGNLGLMNLNQNDIELELGIRVNFSSGFYRQGDYWTFPARTAPFSDVEWVPEGDHPPDGVPHHFAPLAFVYRQPPNDTLSILTDCRNIFPPLTAITAGDVLFDDAACEGALAGAETVQEAIDALCRRDQNGCTLLAVPGPGWEAVFNQIADGQDAQICFQVGEYPLAETAVLAGKGHIRLAGSGHGTRINAINAEAALRFENCDSVTVSDLFVRSGRTSSSGSARSLNGTLTFCACDTVTVENVSLQCGAGARRQATCLTVIDTCEPDPNTNRRINPTDVRIRHCDFSIGNRQTGLLLVNAGRATVEDNHFRVTPKPSSQSFDRLLADRAFRANARKLLISDARFGDAAAASGSRNATVRFGGNTVNFKTASGLSEEWQRMIDREPPGAEVDTPEALLAYVGSLADRFLIDRGSLNISSAFRSWFRAARQNNPAVAAQGIVVGGRVARDVRILNNTVDGVLQGVRVGVSHRESRRGTPDMAGIVTIKNNRIRVLLPSVPIRERYGIFTGNCSSLLMENNFVNLQRSVSTTQLYVEGIRIYGHLGKKMIIRHNHLDGFTGNAAAGIRVQPLNSISGPQWLVADNVALVIAPTAVRQSSNLA